MPLEVCGLSVSTFSALCVRVAFMALHNAPAASAAQTLQWTPKFLTLASEKREEHSDPLSASLRAQSVSAYNWTTDM